VDGTEKRGGVHYTHCRIREKVSDRQKEEVDRQDKGMRAGETGDVVTGREGTEVEGSTMKKARSMKWRRRSGDGGAHSGRVDKERESSNQNVVAVGSGERREHEQQIGVQPFVNASRPK